MTAPLLELHDVGMQFVAPPTPIDLLLRRTPDRLTAVDSVSLQINAGEAIGLVGESGCGKSTLARCIVGLYQPTSGSLLFEGKALNTERSKLEHRRIQIVFQDPYSSLNPRKTIRQMLSELLRVHAMVPPAQVEPRCRELLELVGLPVSSLDVYPRQLSGGQRQRVSIARALALEPDILVADEPVSALDVSVQAAILNLLNRLREQMNLTLVLITHDLSVVRYICDRTAVMYLGRIVEFTETETLFRDPRHPYTRALLSAVPSVDPAQKRHVPPIEGDPPSPYAIPTGCRFHPRCPIRQDICTRVDPDLEPGALHPHHQVACHFAWDATGERSTV